MAVMRTGKMNRALPSMEASPADLRCRSPS
jgi:hypothetical protein